jgi:hypothetical protein
VTDDKEWQKVTNERDEEEQNDLCEKIVIVSARLVARESQSCIATLLSHLPRVSDAIPKVVDQDDTARVAGARFV